MHVPNMQPQQVKVSDKELVREMVMAAVEGALNSNDATVQIFIEDGSATLLIGRMNLPQGSEGDMRLDGGRIE